MFFLHLYPPYTIHNHNLTLNHNPENLSMADMKLITITVMNNAESYSINYCINKLNML
jgi:hypothetical protein